MPKQVVGTLQAANYQADMGFCGMASDQLVPIESHSSCTKAKYLPEKKLTISATTDLV
ncbi:hypothetical protein ACVEIK_009630 [Klebsiella aerogenes]|uniref:hypothetical protein n=1 Tax=Klebsiella aerogenes TaxID=548 RepID=UPI00292E0D3A|nr:hypothetical protein [Klebsiella aerogenes]